MPRAALARHVAGLVGGPGPTWLTGRRPALAADAPRGTGDTLEAIARASAAGSACALPVRARA